MHQPESAERKSKVSQSDSQKHHGLKEFYCKELTHSILTSKNV